MITTWLLDRSETLRSSRRAVQQNLGIECQNVLLKVLEVHLQAFEVWRLWRNACGTFDLEQPAADVLCACESADVDTIDAHSSNSLHAIP